MTILVTGGAGYIGTHTLVELLSNGHNVVVVDNLVNSHFEAVRRVEKITGTSIPFYRLDLRDKAALISVMKQHVINSVIHFAGLKAVGDSVAEPLTYYDVNLTGTLSLLEAMKETGVKKIIFSSSSTVYGEPVELPLRETSRTGIGITNPYGWTKYMIEQILRDSAHADPDLAVSVLRYFNPVGAHPSGEIGEDPNGVPNNLLPYIAKVAIGELERVTVFGDDYDTPDGSGVRDYIHVDDLAKGHTAALTRMAPGFTVYNLGNGHGVSVFELIAAFSAASGVDIPYMVAKRRPGDVATSYADPSKANHELGWKARLTIADACHDAWRWQIKNPHGYGAD